MWNDDVNINMNKRNPEQSTNLIISLFPAVRAQFNEAYTKSYGTDSDIF